MSLSQLKRDNQKRGGGEVLTPLLKKFTQKESLETAQGIISRKEPVIHDSKLSIEAFKDRIEEFNHGEDDKLTSRYFHPSAIGKCKRAIFFDIKGAPQNEKPVPVSEYLRTHFTFEVGTYFHVLFQNLCERAGLLTKREAAIINHKYKIIGHMDGELTIDGERYALEIKTSGSWAYGRYVSSNAPDHAHVMQMTLYMGCLGLDKGIIFYFDKDRSNTKEFIVEFDPKLFEKLIGVINNFRADLSTNNLPAKEGDNPSLYPCRFCAFSEVCFDNNKVAKFMDTLSTQESDDEKEDKPKKKLKAKRTKKKLRSAKASSDTPNKKRISSKGSKTRKTRILRQSKIPR